MTPKLVIFDCDGVLVDTEPTTDAVLTANLARYGLDLPVSEISSLFLGGTMRGAGEIARSMGADLPEDWLDEITEEVNAALAKGVDVFEGVIPFVDDLARSGIASAIASNGPLTKMRVSLGPSGLWDRFTGRIHSGRDNTPKPAPEMLLDACAAAGVAPQDAVMIDDTKAGWKAAQAANMPCFAFLPALNAPDNLFGAKVVSSFDMIRKEIGL